jgi:hypothetical protein
MSSVEVAQATNATIATGALRRIGELYAIEAEVRVLGNSSRNQSLELSYESILLPKSLLKVIEPAAATESTIVERSQNGTPQI